MYVIYILTISVDNFHSGYQIRWQVAASTNGKLVVRCQVRPVAGGKLGRWQVASSNAGGLWKVRLVGSSVTCVGI